MQIAICENSAIERELFSDILAEFFDSKSLSVKLEQYENGIELLSDIEEGKWFDGIFVDVYTNNMLGLDIARKLRKIGYDGKIIFLTVSTEYVIESYEVGASGYILKPYDYRMIADILNRILKYSNGNLYCIKQRSKYIGIPYEEIIYIESRNTKCIFHRADGSVYTVYRQLDRIEDELADRRFLRCHQSYLVNMDYVMNVDKQFWLTTGDSVQIRQRNIKAIRERYYRFFTSRNNRNRFLV